MICYKVQDCRKILEKLKIINDSNNNIIDKLVIKNLNIVHFIISISNKPAFIFEMTINQASFPEITPNNGSNIRKADKNNRRNIVKFDIRSNKVKDVKLIQIHNHQQQYSF